jgi:ribosomal protein S18 acetylase RimI-like enzyme
MAEAAARPAPPDGASIRALRADDLPAYKALRDAMLADYPDAFTSDAEADAALPPEYYRARLGTDRPEGGPFTLGAFDACGTLVGAVTCERDRRAKVHHIGHITAMMVTPAWQRRGVGRALMQHALEAARAARGLTLLTISVSSHNTGARELYEDLGFRPYGRLSGAVRLDGRYIDKDYLTLWLTDP